MKLFSGLLFLFILIAGCSSPKTKDGSVPLVIKTMEGNIYVSIYPEKAPQTCKAFLDLVDEDYFDDASFYRVMNIHNQPTIAHKAEFVQGGVWKNKERAKPAPKIPHESTKQTGILHKMGTLSFARNEPGTADSEFFICVDDQPGLDYGGENNPDGQGYAAFGMVTRGMDVVRRIYFSPDINQYLIKPVFILSIDRL